MQKLVNKATETPWGLDWFVQSGHGGNGNRNCTLAEDASLATPAFPLEYASDGVTVLGPNTTWQDSNPAISPAGDATFPSSTPPQNAAPFENMWSGRSLQEFQYPLIEYLAVLKNEPLFMGEETDGPGHEHISMSVITGQMPSSLDKAPLPTTPGYTPLGSATAVSQWEYCFDRVPTRTIAAAAPAATTGTARCRAARTPRTLSWNAAATEAHPGRRHRHGHEGPREDRRGV